MTKAQLQERLKETQRALDMASNPKIMEMHIANGIMAGTISGDPFIKIVAAAWWDLLVKSKAKNYVEMRLEWKGNEMLVTLHRLDGKTPHALRMEAEAERDRYRRAVEAIRERREHSDYSLSDEDDCAAMLADIDRIAAEALKDQAP